MVRGGGISWLSIVGVGKTRRDPEPSGNGWSLCCSVLILDDLKSCSMRQRYPNYGLKSAVCPMVKGTQSPARIAKPVCSPCAAFFPFFFLAHLLCDSLPTLRPVAGGRWVPQKRKQWVHWFCSLFLLAQLVPVLCEQ